jgi:hypothetical protein
MPFLTLAQIRARLTGSPNRSARITADLSTKPDPLARVSVRGYTLANFDYARSGLGPAQFGDSGLYALNEVA